MTSIRQLAEKWRQRLDVVEACRRENERTLSPRAMWDRAAAVTLSECVRELTALLDHEDQSEAVW